MIQLDVILAGSASTTQSTKVIEAHIALNSRRILQFCWLVTDFAERAGVVAGAADTVWDNVSAVFAFELLIQFRDTLQLRNLTRATWLVLCCRIDSGITLAIVYIKAAVRKILYFRLGIVFADTTASSCRDDFSFYVA